MSTKKQAQVTQNEALKTLERALRNESHLRLTAEQTKALSKTQVSKKLIKEDLTQVDASLADLESYKSQLIDKVKRSVKSGTGLRLSSMELDLMMETPLANALGIEGLLRKKTVVDHLASSINKLMKAISLEQGVRFTKLELNLLSKTNALRSFLGEENKPVDNKQKEDIDNKQIARLKEELSKKVVEQKEPLYTDSTSQEKTSFVANNKSENHEKLDSNIVSVTEIQKPAVETKPSAKKPVVEDDSISKNTEDSVVEKPSVTTPVAPRETKPDVKREYCIAREVPMDRSIGLSDLEFLVDRNKSNTLFWTTNNYEIIKIYPNFDTAKEFVNNKEDRALRVIPKKQAIRKIEEQIEIISYERSLKNTPVGVGDGLTKLNLI